MKNFYFLIKIVPNPVSNDSISIGLVVISSEKLMVRFSPHQIRIAKSLLAADGAVIDFIDRQITTRINDQNKILETESRSNKLFKLESFVKSEYIEYLNVYSNNLLQFSKPVMIDSTVDDSKFDELFTLMISNKDVETKPVVHGKDNFYRKIAEKLILKVQDKVHTNIQFNPQVLPSLYFPFEMDCIGMNGVITGAKSIDFGGSKLSLDKHISHYFTLTTLLERKYQKQIKDNNFYMIADEPVKSFSAEHDLWKSVRKQDKIQVIQSDETDIVVEKIEETDAQKFLEF